LNHIFDIIAGMVLLTSALTGLWRGAAYEVVRVMSFLIAAAASLLALRVTGPIVREMMDPDWLATGVAVVAVFILVYVVLRLLGASLTQRVAADSTLSALDRGVGFGFGLIRALVILGMFNLLFSAAAPPDKAPAWVTGAALFPLTAASGKVLRVFAPQAGQLTGRLAPAITSAVRQGATSDPKRGYSDDGRRQLDDLVERVR
jgi:membrane protein required for colicin V production